MHSNPHTGENRPQAAPYNSLQRPAIVYIVTYIGRCIEDWGGGQNSGGHGETTEVMSRPIARATLPRVRAKHTRYSRRRRSMVLAG